MFAVTVTALLLTTTLTAAEPTPAPVVEIPEPAPVEAVTSAPRKAPPPPWSNTPVRPEVAKPLAGHAPAAPAVSSPGSQQDQPRGTMLYINPVAMVATVLNLELEQHLADSFSLHAGGGLSIIGVGWMWQAGARYYYGEPGTGWRPFLEAHARQSRVQLLDFREEIGGGALIGTRLVTASGFTASLGAGGDIVQAHYTATTYSLPSNCWLLCFPVANPREVVEVTPTLALRASIGWAF